ncbi:hypothetical protein AA102526_2823 [Asaia lannensis NBRC 102526]|nr:hypothetical protein AA102526_2823 [Asaia lannensis NBRC 102526]
MCSFVPFIVTSVKGVKGQLQCAFDSNGYQKSKTELSSISGYEVGRVRARSTNGAA